MRCFHRAKALFCGPDVIQTYPKPLVERFYSEVWNHADEKVAREILDPALSFRGSLGPSRRGVDGFIEYMRSIHSALGDYRCIIEDFIATEQRAAARMRFTGVHRGAFVGVPATGRPITWVGSAFFTMASDRWQDAQPFECQTRGSCGARNSPRGQTRGRRLGTAVEKGSYGIQAWCTLTRRWSGSGFPSFA